MLLQQLYIEHVRVYLRKSLLQPLYIEHLRVYLSKCYSGYYM